MLTVLVMICAGVSPHSMRLQEEAIHARRPLAVVKFQRVQCTAEFEPLE